MKVIGIVIAVVGVLVLMAGLGMDTTETSTTCYESDFSWSSYNSRGCVETTYNNPAPKIGALSFGFGMIVVGGILASRSESSKLFLQTSQSSTLEHNEDTLTAKLKKRKGRE